MSRVIKTTHDTAVCSALHRACFENGWTVAMMDGVFALPALTALLAFEDDVPAGMMLYTRVADEAEIVTICVHENYRGRGMAADLMNDAFSRLRTEKARAFFLEVAVDNTAALALYRRFGFEQTGVRKGYYRRKNGVVDALTMRAAI